ncbi:50S ribosomal protein L4 [Rhodohalobacter sp.]|uniref:50S ribosomal protein L4 n=1 Tax=Rhodohalobacter sp. TaxID=1974210 RepID=UPI00356B0F07
MELSIYKTDGTSSKNKAQLSDSIFAIEPNETVLYEDVRRIQSNNRQGTAKTKERGEVRGGGKKAYKQKGTGMARRGSIRSPLLKGGGTVFGPKPRSYTINLSKKAKRLARKSALSLKVNEESLMIVEDFSYDAPKTKQVVELLTALKLDGKKVLLLTPENDKNIYISARNIPGVNVLEASKPSTYEIMKADVVVFQESSISVLENSIEPKVDEEAA